MTQRLKRWMLWCCNGGEAGFLGFEEEGLDLGLAEGEEDLDLEVLSLGD